MANKHIMVSNIPHPSHGQQTHHGVKHSTPKSWSTNTSWCKHSTPKSWPTNTSWCQTFHTQVMVNKHIMVSNIQHPSHGQQTHHGVNIPHPSHGQQTHHGVKHSTPKSWSTNTSWCQTFNTQVMVNKHIMV